MKEISHCRQCGASIFDPSSEVLLGDLPFCSDKCSKEWCRQPNLTVEQIKHWRRALALRFGEWAFIMPVKEIERLKDKMNEALKEPNETAE
jgi:hypothetical protein